MLAVRNDGDIDTKVISNLIDSGADVNAKKSDGKTALMLATDYNKNFEMLLRAPEPDTDLNVKPSFNCAKAARAVEKEICNDKVLSKLDVELNDLYSRRLSELNRAGKADLRRDQRIWLNNRNEQCESPAYLQTYDANIRNCLVHKYQLRISELR